MVSAEPTRTGSTTDDRGTGSAEGRPRRGDRTDDDGRARSHELPRRRLLVAVGAVATAGVAGCSGVTQQSFEAGPVVLSEDGQETLWVDETSRDSQTSSRKGPAGTKLEITNHAAVYSRAAGLGGR